MANLSSSTLDRLKSKDRPTMEQAFNEIYDEYSYLVYYVSFSLTHDAEISKDITNEVFMKFYEKRYSIKKEKNLKYYLLAASKNLSLNHVNQSSHVVTMDEEGTSNDRPVDDFSSYLSKFEGFLDKDEIDLVVYRFLYDFKFREIAKDKGVSTNVITSKYKRVMEKIKAHYPKGSI